MVARLLGPVTLSLAVLVSACGTSADGSSASGTCSYSGSVPETPDAGTIYNAPLQQQAESEALAALDKYVGVYLRGDATVYRGTLSAQDNQGVLHESSGSPDGGTLHNQTIPSGPAVAALTIASGTATLTVHSVNAYKHIVLTQEVKDSSTTNIGIILAEGAAGGNSGSCAGCVPGFTARPQTISFSGVNVSQVVNLNGRSKDRSLHISATASLELVTPCGIQFSDLAALNANSGLLFQPRGDEYVAVVTGGGYTWTGPHNYYTYKQYTLELYVSATNLASYGVRNFEEVEAGSGDGGGG
jgi:hypothetical protein